MNYWVCSFPGYSNEYFHIPENKLVDFLKFIFGDDLTDILDDLLLNRHYTEEHFEIICPYKLIDDIEDINNG